MAKEGRDIREKTKPSSTAHNFPIVGIGASAGGLDAFTQLLKAIPLNSEMAYVVVQHLNPNHESNLTEILSRVTKIPIEEITDDVKILPNHIYVMPAGKILTSIDGVLKLTPRDSVKTNLVIDIFFTSIAVVWESMAVGVVLSGTGTDGTVGLKMIKEHGGITIAQDESAAYGGMPQSAVDAKVVDFVLPAEKIPAQLLKINNSYTVAHAIGEEKPLPKNDEIIFTQMLQVLYQRSGVDFKHYKQSTVNRRIGRRMALHKRGDLVDYFTFLRSDKAEQDALFQDMLISVTSFFRDPKTFETLTEKVFPALLKNKHDKDAIRFWIAGCATGEETYSIAICLHEFLGKNLSGKKIQIFASDISEIAINKARTGIYSKEGVQNISEERLNHYFTKTNGSYRVNKTIRDLCVFANHNFLKDPPFAKMDLISCRNVLIYMDTFLQKRALTTFHYALKESGILLLGKSETVSAASELFTPFDKKHKTYSRKAGAGHFMQVATGLREETLTTQNTASKKQASQTDFRNSADAILISKSPAAVIINEEMDIVHIHGDIDPFLKHSPGKPSLNLLKMAREGLAFELRNAMHKVKTTKNTFIKADIPLKANKKQSLLTIEVIPLKDTVEPHYLILFTKTHLPEKEEVLPRPSGDREAALKRNEQLEKELAETRDDMLSIAENMEAANEELQSANEELQSSNEEMQSLNEELETSKEELQATNEELISLNQELTDKQEQFNTTRDYAEAIVSTIKEPLIVLDKNLRIKSANASFYKKFKLTEQNTEGSLFYELQNRQWDNNELRSLLENILPQNNKVEDFEMVLDERIMRLNGREIVSEKNTQRLILLAIEDVTDTRLVKKLKESETTQAKIASHLKLATDSANLGTWSFDVKSEKLEWSALHNKMWGYDEDREDIAYEDWYKLIDASDKEKVFRLIEEAKINHTVYDVNYCINRANDGALRCIRSIGKYYYNDNGEAETLTGISIDISDEKEIDETLRYRKALLEAHNEANRDGLLLVDAKGKIISYNKSFIDIWRMPKEIVDAKDDDLALAFAMTQLVNPQQFVDKVKWMYEHPSESCKDELEFIDGRIIERHGYSVWGDDGTYYAWSWTFRDITEHKAAAEAIKESEERVSKERTVLYNSFMNAPAGIAIYKGDTHIYEFANVEHEITARRKITIGKTVQALFPELEQQGLIAMLDNVYATGEPFVANEFPIELSNEENDKLLLGYYNLVVQPLIDEKGNIDRILSHAVEVTHQVEARKQIEESQQRFSMLADNIPNLTWMAYADGNIFWYNKKWFEYTGTTMADMEGWGWQSVHDPEVLPQVLTRWKASIDTGQPFEMVFPLKGADGKFRKFLTRVLPVLDSENKIYRWFGTNTDISKQIEAEDKIKESEAKFRMLSENIPHMVWTATPDGQKNFFNKYFIDYTGFSFEELTGDGWHKIIFPDDLEKELEQWHHHLKTGEDFKIEKRVRHHNDTYRWHISHGIALKDEDGKIIGWIGTNTDITEQKNFSEALETKVKERTLELYIKNLQLEQTNEELISFSYISSHDLQEPLRKIQMFSSRILETEADTLSENAMNYFERMQRSANRMQTLIQDLIAYSRTNVQETNFENTDLNKIIEDVKETLSEELEHKDVTFKLKNICDIKIIPIQFTQVILNLVSNSIKFAKADQPLVIEIECEEVNGKKAGIQKLSAKQDYIHIRVSDNGIGFEPHYNERIFEVFQRLHGREEYTGTGIGLAIVKRIIENHDGIILANGKINVGATFDIYIPI